MKKYLVCIERSISSANSNTVEIYMAVFATDKEAARRIVQEITARTLTDFPVIDFTE